MPKTSSQNSKRARPYDLSDDCCTQHKSAGAILSSEVNPTPLQGRWTTSTFHFKHVQTSHSCNPLIAFSKLNGKLRKLLTPSCTVPLLLWLLRLPGTRLAAASTVFPATQTNKSNDATEKCSLRPWLLLPNHRFACQFPHNCAAGYNLSRIRSRFFPGLGHMTWTRFAQ